MRPVVYQRVTRSNNNPLCFALTALSPEDFANAVGPLKAMWTFSLDRSDERPKCLAQVLEELEEKLGVPVYAREF